MVHFIFIPLLAPGHFIPMIDMAKLIAGRGISATIFVTPLIITRYAGRAIHRASNSGLPIRFIEVPFPFSSEIGLPQGCETADALPPSLWSNFFTALDIWLVSVENSIQNVEPFPTCMITDRYLPGLAETSMKFGIPRIIFDGMGCFNLVLKHHLELSKVQETVKDSESFVVPGLPDRIELTKEQLPAMLKVDAGKWAEYRDRIKAADEQAYGIVINSFRELENNYVEEVRTLNKGRAWCVGPLSLFNRETLDIVERGNRASIDETECSRWLNEREPGSVIYACFGSLNNLTLTQLVELGLGLEASNRPFVWVMRDGEGKEETERWITESGYEGRIRGRGLLIRGWAPQVFILSHEAIGAFLTHCGWNSTMEGVCSGVPMITWPLFAEQFFNEKLIVQILRIGVSVGSQTARQPSELKDGEILVVIKRETIMNTIDKVMAGDEEGDARRRRAREVAEKAKKSVEEGGSSNLNLSLLIEEVTIENPTCSS
ncbi:UDP-glycosyltransferase 73C4-like [Impatiens glandulifera]|uniref:UDP-glycosyltransferase 73C4-like n=1 Tax=Impatiens glandulifera TaxID=253017 RepID=UPI001FB15D82|nr:UDP-glycosyltransferase 73C4-like [Impatiens glandulifera]